MQDSESPFVSWKAQFHIQNELYFLYFIIFVSYISTVLNLHSTLPRVKYHDVSHITFLYSTLPTNPVLHYSSSPPFFFTRYYTFHHHSPLLIQYVFFKQLPRRRTLQLIHILKNFVLILSIQIITFFLPLQGFRFHDPSSGLFRVSGNFLNFHFMISLVLYE